MFRKDTCRDMEGLIVLRYYGELTAEESAAVERHLRDCASCRAELEDTRRALDALPDALPDEFTAARMARKVRKAVSGGGRGRRVRFLPGYIAAAAAVAAIVLSVSAPRILERHPQDTQAVAQADWEVLENYDVVKDLDVIEAMEDFDALDDDANT